MFESLDDGARRTVVLASAFARGADADVVDTRHLAVALAAVSGPPGLILRELGVDHTELAATLGIGPADHEDADWSKPPFDDECVVSFARARTVMDQSGDTDVGAEHLLVALLRNDTAGGRVLIARGVDPVTPPERFRPEGWKPRKSIDRRQRARGRRTLPQRCSSQLDHRFPSSHGVLEVDSRSDSRRHRPRTLGVLEVVDANCSRSQASAGP